MSGLPDRRPAVTEDLLAHLARRLTTRDRWLARMLSEHKVLTTFHSADLAFGDTRTARGRMGTLHDLRFFDRFRPARPAGTGTAPWHWTLGQAGAAILAAENGHTLREAGYRTDHTRTIAYNPRLSHTLGVNALFVALATTSTPARGLTVWWSETRAAAVWGDLIRPDGYGQWTLPDHRRMDLFIEYDTGTENLERVASKLAGYARLATASQITTPLLIWTAGPTRETHLRGLLATRHPTASGTVPVATASGDWAATTTGTPLPAGGPGPADEVWLPLAPASRRLTPDQLPGAWPQLTLQPRGAVGPGAPGADAPTPHPPGPSRRPAGR